MTTAIQRQTDGTITLTVTIPWEEVKKIRDGVVENMAKNITLPGFRKGKAPKTLAEEKINQDALREETLKILLPKYYVEALKEHKIEPIMAPRVHVRAIEEGKDWEFSATTCEMPDVKLGPYKEKVQKITAKGKIIIPGKEEAKPKLEDIIQALLRSVTVTIPKVLVEKEVDRLLAQTLDEVKRLGLTLEQYLSSTGRTAETIRTEYEQKAENDIKLEFVLQKIAEAEKITVENKEIDEAVQKAKDEAERKHLEANRYLLASILRQQKTLDFLKNL